MKEALIIYFVVKRLKWGILKEDNSQDNELEKGWWRIVCKNEGILGGSGES